MLAMEHVERLCVGYRELVFVVCGVCCSVPVVFSYHYLPQFHELMKCLLTYTKKCLKCDNKLVLGEAP